MTVLTAVERSVLRTLAFVFYQLDREQAKYCASSILRWYFQLQAQLPVSAVESLERVAESVISLSDAKFTSFWLSLLEKEIELGSDTDAEDSELLESRITIQSYADYEHEQNGHTELQAREKTLIRRLYQHIYCSIQSLFFSTNRGSNATERKLATQTPCTSPIDLSDDSHYQKSHSRRKHNRFVGHEDDKNEAEQCHGGDHYSDVELPRRNYYSSPNEEDSDGDTSSDEDESDLFEPGWAVEYMEQESTQVSTELSRRMRKMMHSSIPLNLFRATVAYSSDRQDEEAGERGFVGVISPESFPPTPITRDLQTRRMNCYTVSVLDHATLALRLLEANCSSHSSSSYQQLR
ncbi:hypothetical protein Gpo141_00007418 [Globisporangium polare]